MAGAAQSAVAQKDLWGAIATTYRAAGWLVVALHADRSNPRQVSGPDFLMLRGSTAVAIKGVISGELSVAQAKVASVYEACGIGFLTWSPDRLRDMAEHAFGAEP